MPVTTAMASPVPPGDAPPASAAAAHVAGPNLRCSVCACPVDSPVRGGPAYRRLLACARVCVCVARLTPGVHLLNGKRVRYCANHHTLHPADEFEAGTASARATSQTTCVRARTTSLARMKRQRGAQQQACQASHQPAPPVSPSGEPQQQLQTGVLTYPIACGKVIRLNKFVQTPARLREKVRRASWALWTAPSAAGAPRARTGMTTSSSAAHWRSVWVRAWAGRGSSAGTGLTLPQPPRTPPPALPAAGAAVPADTAPGLSARQLLHAAPVARPRHRLW